MAKHDDGETPTVPLAEELLGACAGAIGSAKTLILTAGAGMGVDSGLPDFRGDKGFWNAYPLYERLGFRFTELANPRHFDEDPAFAWGFYGHRANLYQEAVPHRGFAILKDWIDGLGMQNFVVTSNVDGQFQKAGFDPDNIVEVHGSIHHMQCHEPCQPLIWSHEEVFEVDLTTMRCGNVPSCRRCGDTARPNILMFGDWAWIPSRSDAQQKRFDRFIKNCPRPITIVEIGAGRAVPTIRWTGETLAQTYSARMIRINPREPEISAPHISVPTNAVTALDQIGLILKR